MVNRIELLGLPCAGKTHYLTNSKYNKNEVGLADKQNFFKRMLCSFFILIRWPKISFNILMSFRYVELEHWKIHVKGVLRYTSRVYDVTYRQTTCSILEEGVLQGLWGLAFILKNCKESRRIVFRLYDLLPEGSYSDVHYLSIENMLLKERNLKREKKTRFSLLLEGANGGFILSNSREWMAVIIKIARNNSLIRVNYQTD